MCVAKRLLLAGGLEHSMFVTATALDPQGLSLRHQAQGGTIVAATFYVSLFRH